MPALLIAAAVVVIAAVALALLPNAMSERVGAGNVAVLTTLPGRLAGAEPPASTVPAAAGSTTTPPPTTPVSETTPTTTPAHRRRPLVIHAVGDVTLDPDLIPVLVPRGWAHPWSGLGRLFKEDSLTIVNLECAPSNLGAFIPRQFAFRCDPAALPAMAAAGVEVANMANDHTQDRGKRALINGGHLLRLTGITPVGMGRNARIASQASLFEIGGWKVAVLGFGMVAPTADWMAGTRQPGMANGTNIETMVAAIEAAAEQADLVVVTVHWGVELDTVPRPEDVARATAMVKAGADMVFGHHSHRLNPLGFEGGAPVFWSLGNFVWPKLSEASSTTAVGRVEVARDGTIRACLIPAQIASPGRPVVTAPASCPAPPQSP